MAKCLLHISVFVVALSLAIESPAQILNAPIPPDSSSVQPAGGPVTPAQSGSVEQTGWGIPMPRITLPKLTLPKVAMPDVSAVTGPVKSGFDKVKFGSKKAWEGAKEMLSFGNNDQVVGPNTVNQQKPSFWQRFTARETQPQVPQTVGEFMSQPRLDP